MNYRSCICYGCSFGKEVTENELILDRVQVAYSFGDKKTDI